MKEKHQHISFFIFLSVISIYSYLSNNFEVLNISLACIFAISAASLYVLINYAGILSLAHGAFMGIGGYTYGYLTINNISQDISALILATLSGFIIGLIIGLATSKAKDLFLIVSTLAFGEILHSYTIASDKLGKDDGLTDIPRINLSFININTDDYFSFFIISLFLLIITYIKLNYITKTSFGDLLFAIKQNNSRATFLGANTNIYKAIIFAICSSFASFSGIMIAQLNQYIGPNTMHWSNSGFLLLATIITLRNNIFSAILAGFFLEYMAIKMSLYFEYWSATIGVIMLIAIYLIKKYAKDT